MPLLRKIFFYLFSLIYLTLCPLVVLYAFGYIFNPKKLEIVRTGLVHLSTIPSHATVYIGKSRYKEKTPANLRELQPGKYSLNAYLKDYRPWSREVNVEAGKTLIFDCLLLIPVVWKTKALSPYAFKEFIPIPETNLFLLAGGPKMKDYYVYDCKEETLFPLIPPDAAPANAKVIEKFTMRASSNALFCVAQEGTRKYIWIELKEKTAKWADLTGLFPEKPEDIVWDEKDARYIFALGKEDLNRIDASPMSLFPKYLENVRGFGISDNQMYFIAKNDTAIARLNYDKTNKEPMPADIAFESRLFESKEIIHIKTFAKNILVLWNKKGDFLVKQPEYTFFERDVRGMEFDKETRKLLFWKKDKAGVLDFSAQTPQAAWLPVKGKDILECSWLLKGSYALLHDTSGVYLLRAAADKESGITFVARTKRNSPAYYSRSSGRLYYLDPKTSLLSSLEIIPKNHLLSAPFSLEAEDDGPKDRK